MQDPCWRSRQRNTQSCGRPICYVHVYLYRPSVQHIQIYAHARPLLLIFHLHPSFESSKFVLAPPLRPSPIASLLSSFLPHIAQRCPFLLWPSSLSPRAPRLRARAASVPALWRCQPQGVRDAGLGGKRACRRDAGLGGERANHRDAIQWRARRSMLEALPLPTQHCLLQRLLASLPQPRLHRPRSHYRRLPALPHHPTLLTPHSPHPTPWPSVAQIIQTGVDFVLDFLYKYRWLVPLIWYVIFFNLVCDFVWTRSGI